MMATAFTSLSAIRSDTSLSFLIFYILRAVLFCAWSSLFMFLKDSNEKVK